MNSENPNLDSDLASHPSDPTQQFPDYDEVVEIGRGGMGVVYKARHKVNGHAVVLKTMIEGEQRQLQRFRREAEALAQLKHHNIVAIKTVGQALDDYYFAMEYVEGESLRDRVSATQSQDGQVPDHRWSVKVIQALASGLALCHQKGIVHRDVKPENVVIGYDDRPVLVDFGLVKQMDPHADSELQRLTQTGQMLGTPGFMPPEQLEFKGEYGRIGPAADVWSLGATLYYCLCGQQPFGSLPFSAWCYAMIENTPTPARTLNESVPLWLSDLCQECLQRDPKKRPTMKDLEQRLDWSLGARRSNWRKSFVLAVFAAACLGLLGYFFTLDRRAPELKLKESDIASIGKRAPVLSGQVIDRNPYWVTVQKKLYPVDEEGFFELNLSGLSEGRHTLSVQASDRSGNLSRLQSVTVRIDRVAPTLTFQSKDVQDGFLKLDGLLSEDNCVLKINGQTVPVIARQFRFDIPVSALTQDISVDITDPVGLRTVSKADNIFVIRHSGTRMKSLRQALEKAPIGATLLLSPGVHHCPPSLFRNVEVVGLGEAETVTLQLDRGLRVSQGLSVRLQNLTINSDKREMNSVIQVREAVLAIANSVLTCEGERMIHVTSASLGRGRAVLRVTNTKFQRRFGACIALENSTLLAEDCQFSDKGPSLRRPKIFGAASVELRGKSDGRFLRCSVNSSRNRGVFVEDSSGYFEDCEFKANYCEGVCAIDQSKINFIGCRFLRNNYAGASLRNGCIGLFRDCQLDFNGQTSGMARRRCGLMIDDQSEVDIRKSQLRGNLGAGIMVERSALNLYRCRMSKNGSGDLLKRHATVTRKKNQKFDPPKD